MSWSSVDCAKESGLRIMKRKAVQPGYGHQQSLSSQQQQQRQPQTATTTTTTTNNLPICITDHGGCCSSFSRRDQWFDDTTVLSVQCRLHPSARGLHGGRGNRTSHTVHGGQPAAAQAIPVLSISPPIGCGGTDTAPGHGGVPVNRSVVAPVHDSGEGAVGRCH